MLSTFPNPAKFTDLDKIEMHLLAFGGQLAESDHELRLDGLPNTDFSVGGDRMGGGIRVGHKDAWMRWKEAFYETIAIPVGLRLNNFS